MFPIDFINAIPPDITMKVQLGAASAIYGAIVFAATALALLITYESVVDRSDGRSDRKHGDQDQPLKRAA